MTSTIYDQSGTLSCFGEDVGGMEHVPPEQFCFAFERDPTPTVASVREVEPQPQPEREGSILAGGLSLPTHFGEVLARLEGSPSRERRHVEMKSAVRGLQRALRRPLQEIPTDPAALRKMLKAVVPASTGLTKERWSRIRSLASAAMRGMGCDLQPGRDVLGHSPEWKALAANLQTKAQKLGLSRFMSFCTRSAIRPSEVTEATFRDFRAALETRSLQKAPDAVYRSSVRIWNKAVEEVAGWPSVVLKLERHAHFYSFDWHEFPASFAVDVEEFLDRSACEDEFDPHYVPACRPGTIELRRRQLRQLASLLVHSGFPIEGVKSLTVLAKVENATRALKYQRERTSGQIGVSLPQLAFLLKTIARHWVKDEEMTRDVGVLAQSLNKTRPRRGMNSRNRERLRQFDLKPNTLALLQLPRRIFSEVGRTKEPTPVEARRVMMALAVEILLVAPMRVANLCSLEPERHLLVMGRGKARNRHILIPGAETKTNEDFEMVLPPESAKLIDLYVNRYRARICSGPNPWLFPTTDGHKRNVTSFSRALGEFVKKETGLIMHSHLFRQLAGKLHLDAHPGDIETVRQILNHKHSSTTLRFYIEQRTIQGFRTYDATVAGLRGSWDFGNASQEAGQ